MEKQVSEISRRFRRYKDGVAKRARGAVSARRLRVSTAAAVELGQAAELRNIWKRGVLNGGLLPGSQLDGFVAT